MISLDLPPKARLAPSQGQAELLGDSTSGPHGHQVRHWKAPILVLVLPPSSQVTFSKLLKPL